MTVCPKRLELLTDKLVRVAGYEQEEARRRADEILSTEVAQKNLAKGDVTGGGEFVGGFEGCVKHFMSTQSLPEENARKLCAYIGRQAGKI